MCDMIWKVNYHSFHSSYYFLKFIDYFLCIDQIYLVFHRIPKTSKVSYFTILSVLWGTNIKSVIIYVHRMITEFKCSLFDQNVFSSLWINSLWISSGLGDHSLSYVPQTFPPPIIQYCVHYGDQNVKSVMIYV